MGQGSPRFVEEDEEFAPTENTVVSLLAVAVCDYLNENTPLSNMGDEEKEAVGLGIFQTLATNLTEVVEALKGLEPLMCAILQGPLSSNLEPKNKNLRQIGVEAAQIAFAAMCEGNRLIQGAKSNGQ